MRKIIAVIIVFVLIITTCCSCSNSNAQKKLYSFIENEIKSDLKNPSSLITNEISVREPYFEDDNYCYYIVDVDYSAQNSFGGFEREKEVYYIKHLKSNKNNFMIISEKDYSYAINEFKVKPLLLNLDNSTKIPFSLICTDTSCSKVERFVSGTKVDYSICDVPYNKGSKSYSEIEYLCDFYGMQGIVVVDFYNSNDSINTIEFLRYLDGYYYDAEKKELVKIADSGETSIKKIEEVIDSINNALSIQGEIIEEPYMQANYKNYSCNWILSDSLSIKFKYDVRTDDNIVGFLSFKITNSINGEN